MSMTKMECIIDYYTNAITLDGRVNIEDAYVVLDALNAGAKAMDILSRLDLGDGYEYIAGDELLEEWN